MLDLIIWTVILAISCFPLFLSVEILTIIPALVVLSYWLQTFFWYKDLKKFKRG